MISWYKSLIFFMLLLVSSSLILTFRYSFFLFLKCLLTSHLTLFRISIFIGIICDQSGCIFPSGEVQLYLWMFWCRNIVLLTTRFFGMAKCIILTLLSLLSWCRLSFPIVGLTVSSLPNLALKSPNRIFVWYLGKWLKTCLNSS